jgi:hypothetical protein
MFRISYGRPTCADIDVNPASIEGIAFMVREIGLIYLSQTCSHP